MKGWRKRWRAFALLAAALVAAAVIAVFAAGERDAPPSPVEAVPVTWQEAREAPMHVVHVGGAKVSCGACHVGDVADGATFPTASLSACSACHAPEDARHHRGGAEAATTCLSCHVFGAGKSAAACVDCHARGAGKGAPTLASHAGKDVACGACHDLHGEEPAFLADCTTCHEGASSAVHGRFAAHASPDGHASPDAHEGDAHEAGAWAGDAAAVAHVREAGARWSEWSGISGHADAATPLEAGSLARAAHGLDPGAAKTGEVCSVCHAPHTGRDAARGACATCHAPAKGPAHEAPRAARGSVFAAIEIAAPKIALGGRRVAGHEACVTCHEPHRARRQDVRACAGCHAERREAADIAGHASCTGCHTPHAPQGAAASCVTCHAQTATLGADHVGAHAACVSCHDPHAPKAPPGARCVECHASVKPSHPSLAGRGDAGACTGCHAPHGAGKRPPVARAPHGATVASASRGVGAHAALPRREACSSCHTSAHDDRAMHAAGKIACTQCHAPHAFSLAGAGATFCATCHASEATRVRDNKGHAQCGGCHGAPHAPKAKPACASCHAPQASSAPKGHATCTNCHDAHSGARGPGAACASCHADKTRALHGTTTPRGCADCHRAHGPGEPALVPACTSCHQRASLPGLHAKSSHATCATCHGGHAPPRPDRATCTTTCHVDRRGHQPEAKVCNGCHIFTR